MAADVLSSYRANKPERITMTKASTIAEPYPMDGQSGEDAVQQVKNRVVDTVERAQAKLGEAGRSVVEKIDENRGPAADKLEAVASTLHESADFLPGGATVTQVPHRAAEKVEATAAYVREHDVHGMMADMRLCIREHPVQSLLAAAAAGFFLGRALRSDD
jgi:ElaB/YqjD/DUF883 family membrane-anchored ribosome-binding protein